MSLNEHPHNMGDSSAENAAGKQGTYGDSMISGHPMGANGERAPNQNFNNQGKLPC